MLENKQVNLSAQQMGENHHKIVNYLITSLESLCKFNIILCWVPNL